MISTILVATDGSRIANKAVKYSAELARQTKAHVKILSVVDDSALIAQQIPAHMSHTHIAQPVEQYLRAAAEHHIGRAEKVCKKYKVSCTGVIRSGRAVEEILREANKSKADIIVVGSHGKGAIESAVLGSVTYGVIHKSTRRPVLVIR